ncbi:MAG TPA: type II CAAX endopeptidase family protein [Phycisphaerae bacterium]|nr:type II CAAX endopeptidase family protein [Phycisphaerae bacterium]
MALNEILELSILATGTLLLLAGVAYLTASERWREVLRLPPLDGPALQPIDAALAIVLFLTTGSIIYSLLNLAPPEAPTTQAAETAIQNPSSTGVAALAQLVNVVAIIAIVRARFGPRFAEWGLTLRRFGLQLLAALGIYLAVWPVCTALLYLSEGFMRQLGHDALSEHPAILTLLDRTSPMWVRVLTIASAVALAPMVEELVFRGVLFRALATPARSRWVAAILSGCVFGLIHLNVVQTVAPLIFFGVVLACVYAKTGSLTLVVLVHAIFNAKTVLWLMISRAPAT